MTILDTIIAAKRREVQLKKSVISIAQFEKSTLFARHTLSLRQQLNASESGMIAEFKRRSPSKGIINCDVAVYSVARDYESAGACGISVLTDSTFFGGSLDDLILARAVINIPLLRKEFIIDVYQILEAKAAGADVILLIAAVLPTMEIKRLSQFAKSLQLEVLVEIHNIDELQNALHDSVDMIGVNNRNLKTFEVDINNSVLLSEKIPNDFLKISESGIDAPETVTMLRHLGYQGFLIGERFIKTKGPGNELRSFISQL